MASGSQPATPILPTLPPIRSFAQANPIDLTLDDDDDEGNDTYSADRRCKRVCTLSRGFNAANGSSDDSARVPPYHSGLSPAMSASTLLPEMVQPSGPPTHQWAYPHLNPAPHPSVPNTIRPPPFTGPSNSAAFFQPRPQHPPPPPTPSIYPSQTSNAVPSSSTRQIIDLTTSPSPSPAPYQHPPQQTPANFPNDLPPKTPVCIGQLTVTALVLYPIGYLQPQEHVGSDMDWVPVRLHYEHTPNKVGAQETIHIKTPSSKSPTGEVVQGEVFGVVEQKAATHLGPLLGKGLIRLDAKVRRGVRNLSILPLNILVYTPKGNIPVVSHYLQQSTLFLDHPTLASDHQRLLTQPDGVFGPGGNNMGRWTTPAVAGKSVEVQRSQVDELFKSLRDGDELEETEPTPEVATKLYPHQKKALTFLLERERERVGFSGTFSSLWQERRNPLTGQPSWFHIVTQRRSSRILGSPRGRSWLTMRMGLGKTITCVSLIASTLQSAYAFAASPLDYVSKLHEHLPDAALNPAHFAGSVWGMPEVQSEPSSSRNKGKHTREQDRADAEYTRACRIKTKSRATLVICPLSTVVNWEDHPPTDGFILFNLCFFNPSSSQLPHSEDIKPDVKGTAGRIRAGRGLRVYVYHGNARRPDPAFLADFDAVITTYATLASEFSKQVKSTAPDDDDDDVSSDGNVETDERGNQREWRVEATSALQSVHWFRVVLDEAHSIKETNTVGCRASCDLVADRRLCLTGTPVQNKLDDVYALIKFLRLAPLDDKSIWTEFIGTPVKYGQPLGVARLQTIMKCITLRRTKESKAEDGRNILALPPRRDELRFLRFDEHEQAIYNQFFKESKDEFNELSNKNEVMKNYVGILQKILRLRQICDHFELVKNKGLGLIGDDQPPDSAATYEDIVAVVAREGINVQRAAAIFALLKESGIAQCVECGHELAGQADMLQGDGGMAEVDGGAAAPKRGRKGKQSASRSGTRHSSPAAPRVILTRCQHLFCAGCFRNSIYPAWPNVPADDQRCCSACQSALTPLDAVEVDPDQCPVDAAVKKKAHKRDRRARTSLEDFHPSTKVKALLGDLVQFSRANRHSANYDPSSIEVQMVDGQGNCVDDGVVKTVVFSQWTSMLDKVEDALNAAGIRYDRLDGTMKRDERTRAMDALKHDPGCEVLLVSLKAGGVGLNLTAAQRVYLMDPYWNPAVENQAVDRIHRLGQTRPVTTVKLIIENTIEARLLEVQKKKTELANMTLGQNFTKADMLQRRMEELNQLFGS
ncbi:P-loop containing nucleoside triphosphate hydrolase protein [Amylocystis lapponica]|nr:P-loop containing nucleoside triphosphate hydrolase protein [Amylocystis lapponica]